MQLVALHVVHVLGNKAVLCAIVLPIFIAFLWSVLATLGHGITAKRLRPAWLRSVSSSMLALHLLRAFGACVALLGIVWGDRNRSLDRDSNPKPDLFLFYIMAIPSVFGDWRPVVGHELAALACGFLGSNGAKFLECDAAC